MIHNEYAQENPRINRQDRQKITFPGSAYPKEIPSSTLPLHTQKQCTARGSSWGSSIPVSDHWRLLDLSWGEGRQTSRQPADASTPAATLGQTGSLKGKFWDLLLQNFFTDQLPCLSFTKQCQSKSIAGQYGTKIYQNLQQPVITYRKLTKRRPSSEFNVVWLTCSKGSDVLTKAGHLLAHGSNSGQMPFLSHMSTSRNWTQARWANVHHLNHRATAAPCKSANQKQQIWAQNSAHVRATTVYGFLPVWFRQQDLEISSWMPSTTGVVLFAWFQTSSTNFETNKHSTQHRKSVLII